MKFKLIIFLSILVFFYSCKQNIKNNKSCNLFPVKSGNNWGLVDTNCSFKVMPTYQGISNYSCGRALVSKFDKISYINEEGKELLPFRYLKGTDFSEYLAFVLDTENKILCIDSVMKLIFELKDVEEVHVFSDGLAAIKKKEKFGFIDNKGNLVIPCIYDAVLDFTENKCGVANLNTIGDSTFYEWNFIDRSGKKIMNLTFDEVHEFKSNLACATLKGKTGWIDNKGKFVFGNDFEECKSFKNNFASFKKNGAWGLINRIGKIVIEPTFYSLGEFNNGLIPFSLGPDHSTGYLDSVGNIQIKPFYQSCSGFNNEFAFVSKNNRVSLINVKGKVYCEEQFESVPGFLGPELGFINFSLNSRLEINVDTISNLIVE
jgi:hypothetical protein